jgi:hypothetical protein
LLQENFLDAGTFSQVKRISHRNFAAAFNKWLKRLNNNKCKALRAGIVSVSK